ncbi:hypothetical protein VF10_10940 [Nostoc linckia z13]|nr:hypothetical protein VF10_10940 [Nostoc linckia z13]
MGDPGARRAWRRAVRADDRQRPPAEPARGGPGPCPRGGRSDGPAGRHAGAPGAADGVPGRAAGAFPGAERPFGQPAAAAGAEGEADRLSALRDAVIARRSRSNPGVAAFGAGDAWIASLRSQ